MSNKHPDPRPPAIPADVPGVLRLGVTGAVLVGMVATAAATGEREIVFPEVAALLTGLILAPRLSWRTTLPRMCLLLVVCALLGTGISTYVPGHLALKMTLAYAAALFILMVTGTTVAPIVSAAVLPVLLGTRGWVYPVSAAVLALACTLLRLLWERLGLARRELVRPHRGVWGGAWAFLMRTAFVAVWTTLAVACGCPFAAAPPLLVAYTQFSRRRNPIRKHPSKAVLPVFVCALIGASCRLVLTELAGFGVGISVALATVVFTSYFRRTRFYFPPAAAMAILAFLIPADRLLVYPVEALTGISALVYGERFLTRAAHAATRTRKGLSPSA